MRQKGCVKNINDPIFWTRHKEKVSKELKDFVLNQYYSNEVLTIYCDMSMIKDEPLMSVACSYVSNANVEVRHQLLHTKRDVINKNIYAELQAIIFALTNFHKYINNCKSVEIYTDIAIIKELINDEITFKKHNSNIEACRKELKSLYSRKVVENKELSIKIISLYPQFKKLNPFHRSAHNSARNILIK